jgi:hypothetical protein
VKTRGPLGLPVVSFPSRHCPRSHLQNSHPLFISIRSTAYPCQSIIYFVSRVSWMYAQPERPGLKKVVWDVRMDRQFLEKVVWYISTDVRANKRTDRNKHGHDLSEMAWEVCTDRQRDRVIDYWGKKLSYCIYWGGGASGASEVTVIWFWDCWNTDRIPDSPFRYVGLYEPGCLCRSSRPIRDLRSALSEMEVCTLAGPNISLTIRMLAGLPSFSVFCTALQSLKLVILPFGWKQ